MIRDIGVSRESETTPDEATSRNAVVVGAVSASRRLGNEARKFEGLVNDAASGL